MASRGYTYPTYLHQERMLFELWYLEDCIDFHCVQASLCIQNNAHFFRDQGRSRGQGKDPTLPGRDIDMAPRSGIRISLLEDHNSSLHCY